jgi:hypothetical protein
MGTVTGGLRHPYPTHLRFWYQVLTWVSLNDIRCASSILSCTLRYFCLSNVVSNSCSCLSVKIVRAFRAFLPPALPEATLPEVLWVPPAELDCVLAERSGVRSPSSSSSIGSQLSGNEIKLLLHNKIIENIRPIIQLRLYSTFYLDYWVGQIVIFNYRTEVPLSLRLLVRSNNDRLIRTKLPPGQKTLSTRTRFIPLCETQISLLSHWR